MGTTTSSPIVTDFLTEFTTTVVIVNFLYFPQFEATQTTKYVVSHTWDRRALSQHSFEYPYLITYYSDGSGYMHHSAISAKTLSLRRKTLN